MGRGGVGTAHGSVVSGSQARSLFGCTPPNTGSLRVVRDPVEGSQFAASRSQRPVAGIGERRGALTVTGYLIGALGGVAVVLVRCDCGRPEHGVLTNNFRSSRSSRCPDCGQRAVADKRWWKHAHAMPETEHRVRLLQRLASARIRCTSPNDAGWANYGGRGIRVCDEWLADRAAFLAYVRTLPGWDDPSLEMDRIDTDGHYAPGNIRFITKRQNMLNRRSVVALQAELDALRKENADLRSRLRGAEKALHSALGKGASYRPQL